MSNQDSGDPFGGAGDAGGYNAPFSTDNSFQQPVGSMGFPIADLGGENSDYTPEEMILTQEVEQQNQQRKEESYQK